VLLTRLPLNREPKPSVAFDLHVLGTPPALILSQDQTLKLNSLPFDSAALAASLQDQLVNASDLALALFVLLCSSGLFRSLPEHLDGVP
jgi:hypothetical protein